MSAPLRYHRSCVPLALAALIDRPVEEVADMLWGAGWARGDATTRGPSDHDQIGTAPDGGGDILLRTGHRVQWWNPTGELFLSAGEYETYARGVAHRRATTLYRIPRDPQPPRRALTPEDVVGRLDTDPEPEGPPKLLTVHQWLSRFPFGRWLVVVGDYATDLHALAVIDAELVAGGSAKYRDAPVFRALRVLPPKSFQLEGTS